MLAESQRNRSGIVPELFRNRSGIVLQSFGNPSASLAESFRNRSGIVPESQRKPSRIYLGLIQARLHETWRFYADLTQILHRFHADWVAESQRNLSRIVAESFRNRSGIVPESQRKSSGIYIGLLTGIVPDTSASLDKSIQASSRLDFMQPEDFMQILRRFHTDFTQNALRNLSGIVPESQPKPSRIYLGLIQAGPHAT